MTTIAAPMSRPGVGSAGRPLTVRTNTYEIRFPATTIYQLDVDIQPTKDGKNPPKLNRRVWRYLCENENAFTGINVVYDGQKIAYSPKEIPDEYTWEFQLPEEDGRISKRPNRFSVTVRQTRAIELSKLAQVFQRRVYDPDAIPEVESAIHALNIVVQHSPFMEHISRGTSFFIPDDNGRRSIISRGIEMWRGFYTSIRPGATGAFINLDIVAQPMIAYGNMPELMCRYLSRGNAPYPEHDLAAHRLKNAQAIDIGRFVKNLMIEIRIPTRDGSKVNRKVIELTRLSAEDCKFTMEDGQETNVVRYFFDHYQIKIKHPEWPCVRVSKVALYPIELCDVKAGQKYNKKLDSFQQAEALKFTTVPPQARLGLLNQGLAFMQPRSGKNPLQDWQIAINTQSMATKARTLPSPEMRFGGSRLVPRDGVWDLRDRSFISPRSIKNIIVFVFHDENYFRRNDAQRSLDGLLGAFRQCGLQTPNALPTIIYGPRVSPANLSRFIKNSVRESGKGIPDLIVAYLKQKAPEYAPLKFFGDVEMGVPTQCININKARKGNLQYYCNIALKINVKLGGTNVVLAPEHLRIVQQVHTMVMGADVSHAAPGRSLPSVAAVVGTLDPNVSIYGTQISAQESRLEIIQDLASMTKNLLLQFQKSANGSFPKRIIFYRDGVSEGQFPHVLSAEVPAIKVACKELGISPTLTYIVCGKRHHISIFPDSNSDKDRNGNAKAGTIIDTTITSPLFYDWYTQSHATILGTGRSCHYITLLDENKFSVDDLQMFTYHLSFTYQRATRSVSIVTPAYYADRACTRGSLLLSLDDDDSMSTISGHSESDEQKSALLVKCSELLKPFHARQLKSAPNLFFL